MKLGDGRKVTMHRTPECEERSRLATELFALHAEWLAYKDETRQTPKDDPDYATQVQRMKAAKAKWSAAEARYSQHVAAHGCW